MIECETEGEIEDYLSQNWVGWGEGEAEILITEFFLMTFFLSLPHPPEERAKNVTGYLAWVRRGQKSMVKVLRRFVNRG